MPTYSNIVKKPLLGGEEIHSDYIYDHLFELSNGKLDLRNSEEDLTDATSLMRTKSKYGNKGGKKNNNKKRHSNNRKRY